MGKKATKSSNNASKSNFWQKSATLTNHASYLRLAEIINNFGLISEQIFNILPQNIWVTAVYKGVTNIVLPMAKLMLEPLDPNDSDNEQRKFISHTIDIFASGMAFIFWVLKNCTGASKFAYLEKPLLILGVLSNFYKDLKNYENNFKENLKVDIEQPLNDKITLLDKEVKLLKAELAKATNKAPEHKQQRLTFY